MALVRGFLGAKEKKILGVPVAGASKQTSAAKGLLAVYVGENQKKLRHIVPVSYLNQPLFQILLSKAEEDTFLTVTSRIQG